MEMTRNAQLPWNTADCESMEQVPRRNKNPVYCDRCGTRLRATNTKPYRNLMRKPVCDPCHQALLLLGEDPPAVKKAYAVRTRKGLLPTQIATLKLLASLGRVKAMALGEAMELDMEASKKYPQRLAVGRMESLIGKGMIVRYKWLGVAEYEVSAAGRKAIKEATA